MPYARIELSIPWQVWLVNWHLALGDQSESPARSLVELSNKTHTLSIGVYVCNIVGSMHVASSGHLCHHVGKDSLRRRPTQWKTVKQFIVRGGYSS